MGINVTQKQATAAVSATTGNDPKSQTLGRLRTTLEGLDPKKYYLKVEGENTPLSKTSVATALDKLSKGHSVSVVKDEGKGEGWGTTSYRRHTGNPRVAEFHGNMFKAASNEQLLELEGKLKAHLAAPNEPTVKSWRPDGR